MKMGKLWSVKRLLRYAPTMPIYSIIKFNKHNIIKNILNNSLFMVSKNVSLKSMLWIWEKPCATNLALYWVTVQSRWYFTLKIHFNPMAFQPGGRLLYS